MNYEPKFVDGYSIRDCKSEIRFMYERDYKFGCGIDRPRIWDLEHTIEVLKETGKRYAGEV